LVKERARTFLYGDCLVGFSGFPPWLKNDWRKEEGRFEIDLEFPEE